MIFLHEAVHGCVFVTVVDRGAEQAPVHYRQANDLPRQHVREGLHTQEEQMVGVICQGLTLLLACTYLHCGPKKNVAVHLRS